MKYPSSVLLATGVATFGLLAAFACSDVAGPSPEPDVVQFAVGSYHACRISGTAVSCWGQGSLGQLGIGATPGDTTPVIVAPAPVLVSLTAGFTHTCGLDGSGAAWCWGSNWYGELGSEFPNQSCGGTPCQTGPVAAAPGLRFRALEAGVFFTCGLALDYQVYCWGLNDTGQLGTTQDGTSCGIRCSPVPVIAAGGRRFRALAAGQQHVCALTAGGAVWCWGYAGLLEDGKHINATFLPDAFVKRGVPAVTRISAAGYHTCALTNDGEAWCWGMDALGAGPGILESVRPVRVEGGHRFTGIASARFTACGLAPDGTAFCWGPNAFGEIGNLPIGSTTRFDTPIAVSGGFRFRSLIPGWNSYCGITLQGAAACWGRGTNGELGSGHSNSSTPIIVPGLTASNRR